MDNEKAFDLKIITPDRVFYEGKVEMVEMNTTEGEIGVYKNHIPLTVIIKPGILTITEDADNVKEAALHEGFATIMPDGVTIMAEIIEWPAEIDVERAEAAKSRAQERLEKRDDATDIARAETALLRATCRIEAVR
ncbi:MAG: ATP synthase F1 subunit epsilon [Lachnospiraceae bacterium]|nr:ATP synthase F1 subunit epsilon [Lachnospiraceae bacterium]MCR5338752.1 ATP synthase F1 subunit epsilon [Lachnospiraceae bacterium]